MIRVMTTWGYCALLLFSAIALVTSPAQADKLVPGTGDMLSPLSEHKPFAEAHIILQISDGAEVHYNSALDIANNLMKHYGGQDRVDIEVIAFGAGIGMLYARENENAERIASLMEHGVRFYLCGNTLDTIERKEGKQPEILPGVTIVQTGVAFMLSEVKRGYLLVHL